MSTRKNGRTDTSSKVASSLSPLILNKATKFVRQLRVTKSRRDVADLKTCRENNASTPLLCVTVSVSACSACSGFDPDSDEVMASSMKPLEAR